MSLGTLANGETELYRRLTPSLVYIEKETRNMLSIRALTIKSVMLIIPAIAQTFLGGKDHGKSESISCYQKFRRRLGC